VHQEEVSDQQRPDHAIASANHGESASAHAESRTYKGGYRTRGRQQSSEQSRRRATRLHNRKVTTYPIDTNDRIPEANPKTRQLNTRRGQGQRKPVSEQGRQPAQIDGSYPLPHIEASNRLAESRSFYNRQYRPSSNSGSTQGLQNSRNVDDRFSVYNKF